MYENFTLMLIAVSFLGSLFVLAKGRLELWFLLAVCILVSLALVLGNQGYATAFSYIPSSLV